MPAGRALGTGNADSCSFCSRSHSIDAPQAVVFDVVLGDRLDVPPLAWRYAHAAVALPDGRVLAAGGMGGDDTKTKRVAQRSTEVFDPASTRWTAATPLPEPRAGLSGLTLRDGSVLLLGNSARGGSCLRYR